MVYCQVGGFVLNYRVVNSDLFDLTGKTAIVTGGSRGIGYAISHGLAMHGADIALVARGKEQLEQAADRIAHQAGRKVRTFAYDLAQTNGIEGLFNEIVRQTNAVDILVNCAGVTIRGRAEDLDVETWSKVHDVNLLSVLVMSQALCRHCRAQSRPGRIINIGSLTCSAARANTAAYGSSKAGVLSLTKTLAVEWAKYGINVNAIGPGYIATELTKPLWTDKEFDKWVLSKTPLGRWGKPDDLAGAAVFLASKAGEFITGQIIYVDGGWLAQL